MVDAWRAARTVCRWFERGEPQETIIGARSKSHYESAWERWLGRAA